MVGWPDGLVGIDVGIDVLGLELGRALGFPDGRSDGFTVGCLDGCLVGCPVGCLDGRPVGDSISVGKINRDDDEDQ